MNDNRTLLLQEALENSVTAVESVFTEEGYTPPEISFALLCFTIASMNAADANVDMDEAVEAAIANLPTDYGIYSIAMMDAESVT